MAATTKTGKIASAMIADGRGTIMYNDRMKDGRRSLKVWGWTEADYRKAKILLEKEGCTVEVVKTPTLKFSYRVRGGCTRLHVTE